MKYVLYIFYGLLVFILVEFLSISFGNEIGSGPGEIGIVVSAISMLCAVIVICTLTIIDAIKNNGNNK